MDSLKEVAVNNWKRGLNCAQAVLYTYKDYLDIDPQILFRVSEGFGSGVSQTKGLCGALSAAVMIAGIKNSDGNIESPKTKLSTYLLGKTMLDEFKLKHGSFNCKELKGLDGNTPLLPCNKCIEEACVLIEKYLIK